MGDSFKRGEEAGRESVNALGFLALLGGITLLAYGSLRSSVFGETARARLFFGMIFGGSIFTEMLLVQYFFAWLHPLFVLFFIVVVAGIFYKLANSPFPKIVWKPQGDFFTKFWLGLVLAIDLFLIVSFLLVRNDAPIYSPWNYLGVEVFILCGLSTGILFFASRSKYAVQTLVVQSVHVFMLTSVTALMYRQGFGFDPFLHRAAEEALRIHGEIAPKDILYSGQYVVVAGLAQLFSIPVKFLDVWLAPTLTALFLPLASYIGLKDGLGVKTRYALQGWMFLFLIPFMSLTFTVPYNVTTVAFFLLLPMLAYVGHMGAVHLRILLFLWFVLLFFHPLLALPVFTYLFSIFIIRRFPRVKPVVIPVMIVAIAVSIPVLFLVFRSGNLSEIRNPFFHLFEFITLFFNPFYEPYPNIYWDLRVIYDLRFWMPILFAIGGISIGVVMALKRKMTWIPLPLIVGLLGTIFLLRSSFGYKDIIAHEQAEFALRLLQMWFTIPLVYFAFWYTKVRSKVFQIIVGIIVAFFLTLAWFFSYPQYNMHYPFISPSVSGGDVRTVRAIDEHAGSEPYAVLSHQMTSAGAIQEFGFRDYFTIGDEEVLWYPIPTGGTLYGYYGAIIQTGLVEEKIRDLFSKTDREKIYFVTQSYWAWTQEFTASMRSASQGEIVLDDGLIIIYLFDRKMYEDTK